MPLSSSRDYLSIGEVLEQVKPDFPDVSISKIRFLEAEGLISPERTASGYRKFYEADVQRLRYILSLQRDHFMPLRVIRERLAEIDANGDRYAQPEAAPAPGGATPERAAGADGDGGPSESATISDVRLERHELLKAAGLSEAQLAALQEYGVIAKTDRYGGHELAAARAAAGLFRFGVEARHLRMYRQFAEREAAFFDQIVSPVVQRKGESAATEAARSLHELVALAARLHGALVRIAIRDIL